MTAAAIPTIEEEAALLGPGDDFDAFPHIPLLKAPPVLDLGQHLDLERLMVAHRAPAARSNSGLGAGARAEARRIGLHAMQVCYEHSSEINYTQGPLRWEGIARHLVASGGHFPTECDCSSWATWVDWNWAFVHFGLGDIVNGERWTGGFTGTGLTHGHIVHHEQNLKLLDTIFYGQPGSNGEHEAKYIGAGLVLSHGSPGIHKLKLHYRPDFMGARRTI